MYVQRLIPKFASGQGLKPFNTNRRHKIPQTINVRIAFESNSWDC